MDLDLRQEHIETSGGVPLYQQIYSLLRSRIEGGELAFNTRLPAEERLAAMLGVSRITVKRAMNELAASGMVTRFRGRGTIVSYSSGTPTVRADYMTPMEHLRQMGFRTEIELKRLEIIKADEDIARELFIELGEKVQKAERVRHLEGAPFSYIVNHTPMHIARKIDEKDIAWRPFTNLLAEAGWPVASAEQTILAQSATGQMARELMLADGAPVLSIRRVLRDSSGRAIQFTIANYRADRYQYHMTMSDFGTLTPSE